MIIPVLIARADSSSQRQRLPPSCVRLGHDQVFLIELQGTLDVEGSEAANTDDQLIGQLNVTDVVRQTPHNSR